MNNAFFQINPNDNVAVILKENDSNIPIGHKCALYDIAAGEKIIKYGTAIGKSKKNIAKGEHVHVHNMETLLSDSASVSYSVPETFPKTSHNVNTSEKAPSVAAYVRADGKIGIRNEIWILPLVGCVNKTAETLASWGNQNIAHNVETNIDGIFAFTHPYGCSQMGEDLNATRRILAGLALHPNALGVLVLSLGCENNTLADFKKTLGDEVCTNGNIAFLTAQDEADEIAAGKKLLERLAARAATAVRENVSASRLIVGFKCGGSDGFSGITANPLVGRFCDKFTAMGGSAVLTEVPEMFGAEHMLLSRAENHTVFDNTVALIENFKKYYTDHNQVVYENPSPGNKEGGITTLEDKSCGCVQKGGSAIVRGVMRYGERIKTDNGAGLLLLEGPGNDLVSTTALTAAGAHIIFFTTGRGTPFGAPVPTLKISTNSALAQKKQNWIDFDAGRVLSCTDTKLLDDDFFSLFLDVASGKIKTKNELNGFREIAILKDGVTL